MTESPTGAVRPDGVAVDRAHRDRTGLDKPFEIRRRSWLFALIVLVSWGLAGGYGVIAHDRQLPYLWGAVAVLVLIGLVFLRMLRHLRTPLLVADLHGVRMMSPSGWVGFLWREMGDIAVEPRHGLLRGPRVRVRGASDGRDLVVPLGLAINVGAPRAEIELARRRDAASY